MALYDPVDGVYRKVAKKYDPVNGVYRKVKAAYDPVDGVYRKYFGGELTPGVIAPGSYYSAHSYKYPSGKFNQEFRATLVDDAYDEYEIYELTLDEDGYLYASVPGMDFDMGEDWYFDVEYILVVKTAQEVTGEFYNWFMEAFEKR